MHLYRVIQPGLGHLSQFKREDHSASIACMLPITTFTQGSAVPESIRMSSSFQMVGYSPSQLEIGHEFVVAKTGGGKDTHNGTEICETYPFGLDHYICEFGDSYRWIVEGFGGTYTTIDPDEIIINPLPAFTDAKDGLLPSQISLGTVEGLSIILLDESRDMSQAEIAASEKALNALYLVNGESVAPTLPDLLESLEKTDFTNEVQSAAAKVMHNNLYNFLDSSNGRAFQGQDNLILSDGITGIDLIKIDKKMLKFYLTFVSLRFAQKAFFNLDNPAKIWMNELHEPIAAAPEVVTRLIRVINRMGRKEGSFMGLITQGMNEIHAIDSEIVSSSPIRTLLVRTDSWQEIGELLDMPQRAIDIWRTYNQDTDGLPYRQCMRKIYGQWHDLFLTFPQLLLDITSTSRNDRKLKHAIGAKHDDIFERLKAFRTQKEA